MKKVFLFILTILLYTDLAYAQSDFTITSYPVNNELTQNNITSFTQDHKGVMWLSTWDGLHKFDGYNFQNYKAHPGDEHSLSNNRIINIAEDKTGFIWAICYDGKVSRFNPETEQFESIPIPPGFIASNVKVFHSNHVWILDATNQVYRLTVDTLTRKVTPDFHFQCKSNPSSERPILYEDNNQNEWILASQSGLYQISPNKNEVKHIIGSEQQGFYAVYENHDEVMFGSDNGEVWHYNKRKKQFSIRRIGATSKVKYIKQTGNQTVYATSLDGFFVQKAGEEPVHFPIPNPSPLNKGIRSAYLDKNNLLWIETNAPELVLFDLPTQKFRFIPYKHAKGNGKSNGFRIIEDANGYEWIYPYFGGLAYYKNKKIIPFDELTKELPWNASDNLYRFFSDSQSNLWISTSHYVGKVSPRNTLFRRLRFSAQHPNKPENNNFRAIMQDNKGHYWTGNRTGEILIYDADFRFMGKLTPEGSITSDKERDTYLGIAYAIKQDHKGRIWIGTKGQGLYCVIPTEKGTYQIQHFIHDEENPYSISANELYSICEDSLHRIWIGSYKGGLNYLDESQASEPRFIHYYNDMKGYPIHECDRVYSITSDGNGYLWVGTSYGILRFNQEFSRPDDIAFRRYRRIPGNRNSLSSNNVQNIYRTSDGEMYIATYGGGLCHAEIVSTDSIRFEPYTVQEGLPSDIIYSIQEDDQKNLWLAGGSGLCRFNLSTKEIERWNEEQIGFSILFSEGESIRSLNGEMVFTMLTGIFHFNPKRIIKSDYVPSIIFTQLYLGDQIIQPHEDGILPKNIEYMKRIEIPHGENYFSIRFAALEMTHPNSVEYMYMLEGFDNQWRKENRNRRLVTYTNLPSGRYRFTVRSTNGDGVWVNNDRSLEIEILPSFWETPWAWIIYLITILLLGYIAFRLINTFYSLRNKVYIEQQLTDIKLRFFTNISHDLRTPLTLITAPLENLLQNPKLPDFAKEQLTLMKRNADQMLKLINQILDFRKLQSSKLKMVVEKIEVVTFITRIMENFMPLARERNMKFTFTHTMEECYVWADADKLEKILFNLLSNAFKFTEAEKHIDITLETDSSHLYIKVKDEGKGIPQDKQKEVFNRFFSLGSISSDIPSTGIGLSIVKEVVELPRGHISLTSQEGNGSCFSITLLLGRDHYGPETEFVLQDSKDTAHNTLTAKEADEWEGTPTGLPCILLVEDNQDMRSFLRYVFQDEYRVLEAQDGLTGLEMARKQIPDIIISDVMMPGMDGVQLVSKIKGDLNTSHIPIILLTAKQAIESKLEAMKEGVDSYITKPFSAAYLKARVENLLAQRKKLQALYCQSLMAVGSENTTPQEVKTFLTEPDQQFMEKLMELMELHIGNGELTVDMLAKELYMSRSSFFAKLKTLTGLSPIEFIQQMRVKRAAQLIEENQYSMSEIATMVGINDSHYFSRYFKKAYSMTPSEYKKQALAKKEGSSQKI